MIEIGSQASSQSFDEVSLLLNDMKKTLQENKRYHSKLNSNSSISSSNNILHSKSKANQIKKSLIQTNRMMAGNKLSSVKISSNVVNSSMKMNMRQSSNISEEGLDIMNGTDILSSNHPHDMLLDDSHELYDSIHGVDIHFSSLSSTPSINPSNRSISSTTQSSGTTSSTITTSTASVIIENGQSRGNRITSSAISQGIASKNDQKQSHAIESNTNSKNSLANSKEMEDFFATVDASLKQFDASFINELANDFVSNSSNFNATAAMLSSMNSSLSSAYSSITMKNGVINRSSSTTNKDNHAGKVGVIISHLINSLNHQE